MNNVNDLIGRILHKITDENDDLQLHLDNNEIVYFEAEGDCCSESWVEHVDSPTKPEKILQIQQIEIEGYYEPAEYKKKQKEEIDELACYFYQIITEGGEYTVELRNNSNGYYGGWLERRTH